MAGSRASRPVAALLLGALATLLVTARAATVHTVITTECSPYFSWQTLGMFYSHRKSGQPGPITRIMCCTPEEYDRLPAADRDLVPTHVAPSYTHHPRNGDTYSAYNKPVAIIDWLAKNDVKEDYVLVIDADMIMREPFTPEEAGARPGRAVSAFFGYMKGVKNNLAMKHVPWVLPRNDTLAGPRGRRGDQVGGFTLMNVADLRRVAPLWLKYTEDVRFDPDAWELTGDAYSTHKGDRPWISEMYGYSYGCAAADVWHLVHHTAMLYPGYEVLEPPKVLHYGLLWQVPGTQYSFDKHWHYQFDPLSCPPWNVGTDPRQSHKGLFAHPPAPRSFKTTGLQLLRDLLAVEVPITLNAAFCERHRKVCPPSDELERECGKAEALMKEFDAMFEELRHTLPDPCRDRDIRCDKWAAAGECEKNQGFMYDSCPLACKQCVPKAAQKPKAVEQAAAAGGTGSGSGTGAAVDPVATAKAAALRAKEQQAQAAQKPQGQQAAADQQAQGGGSDADAVSAMAHRLRLKCTGHPEWSMEQVKECLKLAAKGQEYRPAGGGTARAAGGGAAGQAGGETGQRQEQQLHEDEEALRAAAEGEDGEGAGAQQQADDRLPGGGAVLTAQGGGGRHAVVKRIDGVLVGEARPLGVSRLGLYGILLWVGGLVGAFFLLPAARKAARKAGSLLPTTAPYKSKGRDD